MNSDIENTSLLLASPMMCPIEKVLHYPWKRNIRMRLFSNRRLRRILFGTLILVLFFFCLIFIVIPIVFRYSISIQRTFLFLNFVNNKTYIKEPIKLGLLGTRNLYIESEEGINLGVWHTLPQSKLSFLNLLNMINDDIYDNYLKYGDPVIIYAHGNAGNRAAKHRVELYKVLQKSNFHVVSFDYRGYGDSTSEGPDSEQAVVNDAKAVFKWVQKRAEKSKIFIWGHSLGTGISSHALKELESEGHKASGLILEAPFTNLQEEIKNYPMAKLFQPLPWFDFFFVDSTYDNKLRFASDIYLMDVSAPTLILHAEDDRVVPVHLGKKLYEEIKNKRGKEGETIEFVSFPKKLGYGHQGIYVDKSLPKIISNFVDLT